MWHFGCTCYICKAIRRFQAISLCSRRPRKRIIFNLPGVPLSGDRLKGRVWVRRLKMPSKWATLKMICHSVSYTETMDSRLHGNDAIAVLCCLSNHASYGPRLWTGSVAPEKRPSRFPSIAERFSSQFPSLIPLYSFYQALFCVGIPYNEFCATKMS